LEAALTGTSGAAASIAVVGPAGSLYARAFGRRFGDVVTPADDFVEAAIGNNDTPFAWAGYGPHRQSPSSAADPEQPDGLQGWLRSGDVASLSAAIDRDPGLVNRPDAEGVQPLAWAAFFGQRSVFDLVSARNADSSWATPVNLGPRVNSKFEDYSPMVSPDGRHLFFTSGTPGSDDVYWIAPSVIRRAIAAGRGGL
jgi:hypothetical protein